MHRGNVRIADSLLNSFGQEEEAQKARKNAIWIFFCCCKFYSLYAPFAFDSPFITRTSHDLVNSAVHSTEIAVPLNTQLPPGESVTPEAFTVSPVSEE